MFNNHSPNDSEPAVRIDQSYVPVHYELFVHPNIPFKAFLGKVIITFKCNQKNNHVELHIDPTIQINNVSQNGNELRHCIEDKRLKIFSESPESSPITIDYRGSLDHNLNGFYYINDENVCTQFEPNYARKLLPCFDEPCVKSTFKVIVQASANLKALSNMPQESIIQKGDDNITTFQTTPPMCTYLLAIAIGNFVCLSGNSSSGLPVDIYLAPEYSQFLQFPLKIAIQALDYLENYFDMGVGLPRLQIIGVKKFLLGGMENYGLIVIHEKLFLSPPLPEIAEKNIESYHVSPNEKQLLEMAFIPQMLDNLAQFLLKFPLTSLSTMMDEFSINMTMSQFSAPACLMLLAEVITHEIVHMWAGDIVSPNWWDSLWLNEGYATLLPSLIFDQVYPTLNFSLYNNDLNNHIALAFDTFEGARPVHGYCFKESDSLDIISYNKASMVLRMIRLIVGHDNFRDAYRAFLKKFKNKSAETKDLLDCFSEYFSKISNLDFNVQEFFDAWIYNNGFPLIVLEDNCIRQMPFSGNGVGVWPIPLFVIYGKGQETKTTQILLKTDEKELNFDADWIIIDPKFESFCRVWYVGDWFTKAVMFGCSHLSEREKINFKHHQQFLASHQFINEEDIKALNVFIV